ncbi:MAG: exopolysaccharide transport family protein [Gammaproteobacteria bacterium]
MQKERGLFNDDIDLVTILSIFFDNFNYILSIFLASILIIGINYLSSDSLYRSSSLLEIKNNVSYVPDSISSGLSSQLNRSGPIRAEIEIYKSNETISDAIKTYEKSDFFRETDYLLTAGAVKGNLQISSSESLLTISFTSMNPEVSRIFLDILNDEFISDRKNFAKESSIAGRKFINQEIPRIKNLLRRAEDDLNNFKVSTNATDVIFDTKNRNVKLERLKDRLDDILFKELELKEFYRENHPIYLSLKEQKKLLTSQLEQIEEDLPNIPSTERTLENFKREVEIYSNVLRDLSAQEISLGMSEASSISNVRIINRASNASRIAPTKISFLLTIIIAGIAYLFFLVKHLFGDKITNFDSLVDFVGKEKIIGELPFLSNKNNPSERVADNIVEELLNKTIYEITHSDEFKSLAIVSSRKGAGKTEVSKRIFNKLSMKYKVCLLDLDYRKKDLTKNLYNEGELLNFEDFYKDIETFETENKSVFVPSFRVEDPPEFFASDEFKQNIEKLKENYDYVICDTPPWKLFVDPKIISKVFDKKIYIVANQSSSFSDIVLFEQDIENKDSIRFFYNKFKLYFNFLWLKYQYPYYSRNYYYDYQDYSAIKRNITFNYTLKQLKSFYNKLTHIFIDFIKRIFKNK